MLLYNYSLMVLFLTLVLLVSFFTDASSQFRSFIDNSIDERKLEKLTFRPPNDECIGARLVPSNFPGTTYTTRGVYIDNATFSGPGKLGYCRLPGRTKDVWYKFTPLITSFYSFGINLGYAQMAIATNKFNDATTCYNSLNVLCQISRPTMDLALSANKTYLLYVQPALLNATGLLELTVQRRRPPSNNFCTNATIIDPTVETSMTVDDAAFALHDRLVDFYPRSPCRFYEEDPMGTFWYNFTNPLSTLLSVDVTVNLAKTDSEVPFFIGLFRGPDCESRRCIGGKASKSYDFVAEPLTSYFIYLKSNLRKQFNVTIKGRTELFSVIDSGTDQVIQLLKQQIDYSRTQLSSVHLNFQAQFLASVESAKSVRLTYDNPKRIVCDQKAPYSVFGDSNGNYNNATIPLGRHRVTATPYSQPNCTGIAGPVIEEDFRKTGCMTQFDMDYDADSNRVVLRPFTSEQVSSVSKHTKLPAKLSLQCHVVLNVYAACGFPVQSIRVELRNARTGKLILTRNATKFGRVLNSYHFPVGSYSLRAIVNNVIHPTMNFTVVNTTCDA